MRNVILTTLILACLLVLGGCSPAGTGANTNTASNAAKPQATANNPLNITKTPEAATTNNAPTIAPVMAAYYAALKGKDDAGLKKIHTAGALKNIEQGMKEDKKATISAYLSDYEILPETGYEVRNEKIEGDNAIAEVKGGTYKNWTRLKFAREGGEWKLTGENAEMDAVSKGAANSNTAK